MVSVRSRICGEFNGNIILSSTLPRRRSAASKIGTKLANPLGTLPANPDLPNLAHRDLLRAIRLSVPSGQRVARAMGVQPISNSDLGLIGRGAPDFDGDAPLWFYILREAELLAASQHLGPVGGRICAEVLIGLLVGDPLSWINVEPNWQPPLANTGGSPCPNSSDLHRAYQAIPRRPLATREISIVGDVPSVNARKSADCIIHCRRRWLLRKPIHRSA